MRIAVIGQGYLGLTASVSLAEAGHEVAGVEVDRARLYREFRRALGTKTKMWENVPNAAVDAE